MRNKFTILGIILVLSSIIVLAQANFSTSLHSTREGKATAYNRENGGMEILTNIPIGNLPCQNCHADKYPDGENVDDATYTPSCRDCHNQAEQFSVSEQTCLNCHSRKVAEVQMYPDHVNPHNEHGMKCWSCHNKSDLHGDDGVRYAGMHDENAIKAKCTNCHTSLPQNSAHTMHANSGNFECQACHIKSIVQCQNCHLESVIQAHIKRAQTRIKDFQLLVKRHGKYTSGSFMTHVYNGQTNVIFAPLTGHLIDPAGKKCSDCHYNMGAKNAAIADYNERQKIALLKWDPDQKKFNNMKGIIPLVPDWYNAYEIDFVNYDGDPTKPTDPSQWSFIKQGFDNGHLFYCEPLTVDEMQKLGFTRFPTDVETFESQTIAFKGIFPNPVNDFGRVTFTLKIGSKVNISVYDINGNLVATVADHFMNANEYSLGFNSANLPSGKYIVKLTTYDFVAVKEMIVLH